MRLMARASLLLACLLAYGCGDEEKEAPPGCWYKYLDSEESCVTKPDGESGRRDVTIERLCCEDGDCETTDVDYGECHAS